MHFFRQALIVASLAGCAFAMQTVSSSKGLQRRQIDNNDPNVVIVNIKDPSTPEIQVFCFTNKDTFGKQFNKFPASRWTGHLEAVPSGFRGKIFTFTSIQRDCFSNDDIEYFSLILGKCIRASLMCMPRAKSAQPAA